MNTYNQPYHKSTRSILIRKPILIFAYRFAPENGSIQNYASNLSRRLHNLGYKIIVLALKTPNCKKTDYYLPYKVKRIPNIKIPILKHLIIYFYLAKTIIFNRVKLVHFTTPSPAGYIGNSISKLLNCRFVITCFGKDIVLKRGFFERKLVKGAIKRANWIIAVSDYTRSIVNKYIKPTNQISFIAPGVDSEQYCPGLDNDFLREKHKLIGKQILLTVGTFKESKGIDIAMHAFKILIDQGYDNLKYILIGNGPELEKISTLVVELGLVENVIIKKNISDKKLRFYYSLADIFVLSAKLSSKNETESTGRVLMEAGASELPVIATKTGALPEIVVDGVNGLLTDTNNSEQIASAISKLLEDPELAKNLGLAGRERAIKLYTWDTAIKRTEMIYKSLFLK